MNKALEHSRQQNVKDIQHALHILKNASEENVEDFKRVMGKDFGQISGVLKEIKAAEQNFRASMNDTFEKAVDTSKKTFRQLDTDVHESPWKYLGGTALSSVALGYLLGRFSRH